MKWLSFIHEYINETAIQESSTHIAAGLTDELILPGIKLAGGGVKAIGHTAAFCKNCIVGWIGTNPPVVDEAIIKATCNSNVIEKTPPLVASAISQAKLEEALKAGNYARFKEILEMVSVLERLDPQAVALTTTCYLAALAKKSTPYLKNICMGLISAI